MQDISLHILDLVQNSIVASASLIEIAIKDIPEQKQLSVMIRDNCLPLVLHEESVWEYHYLKHQQRQAAGIWRFNLIRV